MKFKNLTWLNLLQASIIYTLVTFIFFHPLFGNLSTILFGGMGDSQGIIYGLWAKGRGLYSSSANLMLCAPYGMSNNPVELQPLYSGFVGLFSKFFGELPGYNLVVLISFPLTALVTFIFLEFILEEFYSSLIGGFMFGFCPSAVFHAAAGHLSFSLNFTIPLFLFSLFYFQSNRSILTSVLSGIAYVFMVLFSTYWGFFGGFFLIYFVFWDITKSTSMKKSMVIASYIPALVVSIGILLFWFYPVIQYQLSSSRNELVQVGRIRPLRELLAYSALPWDYFLPTVNHPLFGYFVQKIIPTILHGSNAFEQTLYIGVIPVLIVLSGLFLLKKKQFNSEYKNIFLFFLGGAIWMAYISMPPFLPVGRLNIPLTPTYFTHWLVPMFRVLVRAGMFTIFFIACCSAIVISEKIKNLSQFQKIGFTTVILVLMIVDFWSVSPEFFKKIEKPAIYGWLSDQPGDFIVAEYPMMMPDEAPFYRYLFWQRIHGKRLVNGATPDNSLAWGLYEKVKDLSSSDTFLTLKGVGVKYVLVHKDYYSEGRIPYPLKRYFPKKMAVQQYSPWVLSNGFDIKPLITFGNDEVYEL